MNDFSEAVDRAAQWALGLEYDGLFDTDKLFTTGNGKRDRMGAWQFVRPFARGKHSKSMTFIMNLYRLDISLIIKKLTKIYHTNI